MDAGLLFGSGITAVFVALGTRRTRWRVRTAYIADRLRDEIAADNLHLRIFVVGWFAGLLPHLMFRRFKAALYRVAGFTIGRHSLVYGRLSLTGGRGIYNNLEVGDYCRINTPCHLGLTGKVTMGDYVVTGYGVTIITECHDTNHNECRAGKLSGLPVTIQSGAWVGANATLLPGITIGAGAVVGAGSVVTRDVPPHTLVAGNPARPVRSLPQDQG